ncbi:GntR family transcriptional regulator [Paenibacillus eucommiae]|uniref:GntR family transcriptional regulator of gluconate operon n=1 Tax=Paenibacillus eucommiae TaxID=1355755 RepID=A0ABS4J2E3_9BACL|nr:GntR family transcriptional regulator [Paenibacillus eucommiae]MBP1994011.1 GntR family transcriptional regulator of gluconate operon [Paenibacillus eucommiae]
MKAPKGQLFRSFFSSQVVNDLRTNIITGKLPAGEKIVENAIAEEMNVSRGPVRNALAILEAEGLVTFLQNGRTVSSGFTLVDAEKLYEMRSFIELKAIELIFKDNLTDFQYIKQINEGLRKEKHNVANFTNLDVSYHFELMRLSGNKYLLQCWLSLRPLLETILMITNTQIREDDQEGFNKGYVIDHHEKITTALITGNFNEAILFLKEHLDTGKAVMIEKMSEILKER